MRLSTVSGAQPLLSVAMVDNCLHPLFVLISESTPDTARISHLNCLKNFIRSAGRFHRFAEWLASSLLLYLMLFLYYHPVRNWSVL